MGLGDPTKLEYDVPMTRAELLSVLHEHNDELRRRGVVRLQLFGSFARDEADAGSDVDLLVELTEPRTFRKFMGLALYLEDLLGRRVDLITVQGLREALRQHVEQELLDVA